VLIGGMTTSTVLTLLVVPTVYSLLDTLTTGFAALVQRRKPAAAAVEPSGPLSEPSAD